MAKDDKVTEIGDGKKKGRAKQTEIPGTERERIPEIETIAEEYATVRDQWQQLGKQLETLKTRLHDAMRRNKIKIYPLDSDEYERVEIVQGEEDVKVRRKKGRPAKAVGDDSDGDFDDE